MDLKAFIRSIPDYPRPGVLFYDLSTLIANAAAWKTALDRLTEAIARYEPDRLAGIEARGFLAAAPVADRLGLGLAMVRKHGKLPGDVVAHHYDLEYGTDTVEMQVDAVAPGERVVVVDDLLATGGTSAAAIELLRKLGADVCGAAFVVELAFLAGRARLDVPVASIVTYDA